MSTRTHFTGISKKIELQSGVVKELVFNDPFDVNAFKTKLETGGSEIVVNQTFNAIRIDNPSDYNCWFTFYKGIAPRCMHDYFRMATRMYFYKFCFMEWFYEY